MSPFEEHIARGCEVCATNDPDRLCDDGRAIASMTAINLVLEGAVDRAGADGARATSSNKGGAPS